MRIQESDIQLEYYNSIQDCATQWDSIGDNNLYWKSKYLQLLEKYPAKNMSQIYVLVTHQDTLVAKFLFQNIFIKLSESYGEHNHKLTVAQMTKEFGKKLVLPFLKFQLVVSGNALLTGNYGHYFNPALQLENKVELVAHISEKYRLHFEKNFKKPSGILLKDIKEDRESYTKVLGESGFSNFQVEPKMKIQLDPNWNSFDDYLAAMKSKYRVRVRRAKKKLGDGITRRKLNAQEMQKYADKMYALYMETAGGAGFNLFFLDNYYFAAMGIELPEDVSIVGIFEGEEMLGFYTLIKGGSEMDAHFLGYCIKRNPVHQIYLNILYFMIEDAIEENATVLHMSRTALEIKSSVGAKPQQLDLFVKHYTKPFNAMVKQLLKITVPEVQWKERSPFK